MTESKIGLLYRHFLRQFIDNDLVSPDADQHETMALVGTALLSLGLFITVVLCTKYLIGIQLIGPTTIGALDDRLFYISGALLLSALFAVVMWNALPLDARDAAILGPLPLKHGAVVRAKAQAVMTLALIFVAGVVLVPSLVYPVLLVAKLPVPLIGAVTLIAVHASVTAGAGLFGFLVVLAIREVALISVGRRWFHAISPMTQGLLVMVLGVALCLLPSQSSNTYQRWLTTPPISTSWVPPLWFLGAYEAVGGPVIADAPAMAVPERLRDADRRTMVRYRQSQTKFWPLARQGAVALVLVAVVAMAAYTWNIRRLPVPPISKKARTAMSNVGSRIVTKTIVRDPVTQAGFFFTMQTLARSAIHRLTISIAGALAAAAAIGLMSGVDFADHSVSARLLAAQSAFVALLAAGFAHAMKLPAELRANWVFVSTWDDHTRRYVNGTRRFLVLIATFALIVAYPIHALALGSRAATYHFLIGLLWANVCMRIVSGSVRTVPFIRSYSSDDSLKLWLPIFVLVGSGLVWILGTAEALVMRSGHEYWLPAGLLLLVVCLGLAERGREVRLEISDAEMGGAIELGLCR